jgi:FkbM family methyltransferase
MPETYDQLIKNVARNAPHPNIDAIRAAAYSENTTITFYDYGLKDSAYNSAIGSRKGGAGGTPSPMGSAVPVNANRIDDVLEEKNIQGVNLIKIDAESSELFVLQGLLQTIRKYKPGIIVEVGDLNGVASPSNSMEIVRWLYQQGYDAYEAQGGKLVLHEVKDRYEYGNLLFLAKR